MNIPDNLPLASNFTTMPRRGKKAKAAQQRELKKSDPRSNNLNQLRPCEPEQSNNNPNENASKIVSGTLHQGDTRFRYPGIQCTYISFLSLIQMIVKEPKTWTTRDVDACIIDGNALFMKHCRTRQMEPKMLMANELPDFIFYTQKSFICKQLDSQIKVGLLEQSGNESFGHSLTQALNTAESCLLICGGQTVAIAKLDRHLFTFDPHSRGHDGLLHPLGSAVLLSFATVNEAIAHFNRLFDSLGLRSSEQFEIVPLNIFQHTTENTKSSNTSDHIGINEDSQSNTVKTSPNLEQHEKIPKKRINRLRYTFKLEVLF